MKSTNQMIDSDSEIVSIGRFTVFKKIFDVLQRIGRALMLPVAILPAAGLLLGFGTALQNPTLLAALPTLKSDWIQLVANVLSKAGDIVFTNLPILFAIGVAIGLAADGVAGIAALVGYLIMNNTMSTILIATQQLNPDKVATNPAYANVLGIPTLATGVFGGIIIGMLAAYLYNRFYDIELPSYLGFFAGKRFVPIITGVAAIILGVIMIFIWPPIQHGLNTFSTQMLGANPTLSAFIFGLIERSLIPFGLHHIFYSPFWFEFGQYIDKAGQIIHGDQKIFFAQLKDGVPLTAGTFMTGKFPFMMFGLPAAALAMYHEAKPEHKKYVAGIMGSAALTSFLTGITEPIEFTFLFVAPVLFVIHAIFAGLSFMTMQLLNIKIGMTFSGGVIDYILFGVMQNRTAWWLVIPVGLVLAVIYYFGFRFAIRKFNLKTPGREEKRQEGNENSDQTAGTLAHQVLQALGSQDNIAHLDACITRLRVSVHRIADVDKEKLKQLGAAGVLEVGDNIQAIFGPKSDTLKSQIQQVMAGQTPEKELELTKPTDPKITHRTSDIDTDFISPLAGEIIELSKVPDPVFSQKIMGDGYAIHPSVGKVVAPCDGEIMTLVPSHHAIGLKSDQGQEILIHLGIDTVKLNGKGFTPLIAQGDQVRKGQPLLEVDLNYVKKQGYSLVSPIIFSNLGENKTVSLLKKGKISLGEENVIEISK